MSEAQGTAMIAGAPRWYESAPYCEKVLGAESFINSAARPVESLNGRWHYALDQYRVFFKNSWWAEKQRDRHRECGRFPYDYSFNQWPEIDVPSSINTAVPEAKFFEGVVVYTRKFDCAPPAAGERVFIRIGAAHHRSALFLNRQYLGQHLGGFTPFFAEVTGLLKEQNRITVAVDTARNPRYIPTDVTDWFNYGGLYRDVELIRVPGTFVRDYFVRLVPGSGFGKVAFDVTVDGAEAGAEATLAIPEADLALSVPLDADGRGSAEFEFSPELWAPGAPRLYDVEISCGEDRICERIGFREFRVEGSEVLLNGQPVWLKGISCHEDHPERGRTLNEEDVRGNFALAAELGCNFMRLAHYPHHERSARIADGLGLMLWEEIPVYWDVAFGNPDTLADAENQLTELILRDRNRASVIIWSVGNENLDTEPRLEFMGRLADLAREVDGSRPVSAACLTQDHRFADRLIEKLDLIGMNEYYGWYEPDFELLLDVEKPEPPAKPVIITETGGGAVAGHHGSPDQMWTEEYQAELYRRQTETIPRLKSVRGLSPWILHDFRAPFRLNTYQQGYNRKGLVDAWRKHRKQAFDVLRDFYRSL